ncbi:hypothetical protein BH24CHL4_BH24CHL4_05320 [soil metagenome]
MVNSLRANDVSGPARWRGAAKTAAAEGAYFARMTLGLLQSGQDDLGKGRIGRQLVW